MTMAAIDQPALRGELRPNESLRRYNTWRVGGPARQMYLPCLLYTSDAADERVRV